MVAAKSGNLNTNGMLSQKKKKVTIGISTYWMLEFVSSEKWMVEFSDHYD